MKLRRHRFLLSVLLLALCFALSSCSAAGFVPKSDTTWGELFRHFDSEEFSELDPQLQQMMDEAVLSQEVAENEAQPLTEVGSVGMIYPEEDSDGAQEILDKAIYASADGLLSVYASADGLLSDRTETEPGLVVFDLISYPQADKTGIEYNGMLSTFAECPGACVLVALQDSESGEFVAFDYTDDLSQHTNDSGTISQTNMEDNFDNLKPDHQYTIKARAFVLPPEGRTIEGSLYTEASLATL